MGSVVRFSASLSHSPIPVLVISTPASSQSQRFMIGNADRLSFSGKKLFREICTYVNPTPEILEVKGPNA